MTQRKLKISTSEPKSFEEILDHLGGFGKFQLFVLVILATLDFPSALLALLPIYAGAKPEFWTCDGIRIPQDSDPCKCNGTLSAPTPYTSIVGEWSLVCTNSWVSDSTTSVQMIGCLVAGLYSSQIADWYGRRIAMNGISFIFAIGAVLCALAPNIYVFSVGRFLIGAGSAGTQGLSTVYAIEFMPISWRALPTSVRPYGEAMMFLGLLAYFFRPWRILACVTTLSILIVMCIVPLVPESPRWLMQNRKIPEAHRVLARIAKINNRPPLSESVIREISEKEMVAGNGAVDSSGNPGKSSYWNIMKDNTLRGRALCLMAIWFSWAIVGFGLAFNLKNVPGNPYLNLVYLGMADALGFPTSLLIINRLGRRVSVILSMSLGALCLVGLASLYLTIEATAYPELLLGIYVLAKYKMAIARSCIRCLTAESFPTSVRTMGTGLCGIMFSAGAIICPQFVYLGSRDPVIPLIAFAVISVVGSLFTFLMPETTGKPLQDTIAKPLSRQCSHFVISTIEHNPKAATGSEAAISVGHVVVAQFKR